MGVADGVMIDGREGQVKLWDLSRMLKFGSRVPDHGGCRSYDVAMREGGYLHIVLGVVAAWDDTRTDGVPCFDKWGDEWVSADENVGLLGEPYFFNKEEG